MATQQAIPGVPKVGTWEVQYETVVENKKRSFCIMVQAIDEAAARIEAKAVLKAGPPFKIRSCRIWLAET